MTTGDEDAEEDEGSDSEPSEDNLDEVEMAKIIPITPIKKLDPPKMHKVSFNLSKFLNDLTSLCEIPPAIKIINLGA